MRDVKVECDLLKISVHFFLFHKDLSCLWLLLTAVIPKLLTTFIQTKGGGPSFPLNFSLPSYTSMSGSTVVTSANRLCST